MTGKDRYKYIFIFCFVERRFLEHSNPCDIACKEMIESMYIFNTDTSLLITGLLSVGPYHDVVQNHVNMHFMYLSMVERIKLSIPVKLIEYTCTSHKRRLIHLTF